MDISDASKINVDAKRKWIQLGKSNELACGVVVRGAVWWFKAHVGRNSARIDGPYFNLDVPARPRDASHAAAQSAEAALLAAVRKARMSSNW